MSQFKLRKTEAIEGKLKAVGYMKAFELQNPTDILEYDVRKDGDTVVVKFHNREAMFKIDRAMTTDYYNVLLIDFEGELITIKKGNSISLKYVIDWYIIPRIIADNAPASAYTGSGSVRKVETPEDKARKKYESEVVDIMIKEGISFTEAAKLHIANE